MGKLIWLIPIMVIAVVLLVDWLKWKEDKSNMSKKEK